MHQNASGGWTPGGRGKLKPTLQNPAYAHGNSTFMEKLA